jgi:glycosyltransferase involved in cell wall biosynthesis
MIPERVLYLSYFYPLEVVKSRGLPTRNIAAYNRTKRVVGALASAGRSVHVVSPGICARCGFSPKLFHGSYRTIEGGIDVIAAPALVVPFIGATVDTLLFPLWTLLLIRRFRFDGAMIYNYSPSFVLVALLLRMLGIPFVAQIEDIAVPARSDWRTAGETRPIQQLLLWLCMKMVVGMSTGFMVPSRRFQSFLPREKPCLIVPGCVGSAELAEYHRARLRAPIRVLFVGRYEAEHGVDLLIATLRLLRSQVSVAAHFTFDCCGTDNYPVELRALSASGDNPTIRLHGLLSDHEYRDLLAETAVALVLQKGQGRQAYLQSPSKTYEFLAAGKLVIATDVGDLECLSGTQLIMLQKETAEEMVSILAEIVESPEKYEIIAQAARDFSLRESSSEAVGEKLTAFLSSAFGDSSLRPRNLQ